MKKYELLATLAEMELKLLVIEAKESLELIDGNESFSQSLQVLSDYDPMFLGREYCLNGGLYNDNLLEMVKGFDYVSSRFSEFFVAGYNAAATELDTDIVNATVLKA